MLAAVGMSLTEVEVPLRGSKHYGCGGEVAVQGLLHHRHYRHERKRKRRSRWIQGDISRPLSREVEEVLGGNSATTAVVTPM